MTRERVEQLGTWVACAVLVAVCLSGVARADESPLLLNWFHTPVMTQDSCYELRLQTPGERDRPVEVARVVIARPLGKQENPCDAIKASPFADAEGLSEPCQRYTLQDGRTITTCEKGHEWAPSLESYGGAFNGWDKWTRVDRPTDEAGFQWAISLPLPHSLELRSHGEEIRSVVPKKLEPKGHVALIEDHGELVDHLADIIGDHIDDLLIDLQVQVENAPRGKR